jgi:hypothetical protein
VLLVNCWNGAGARVIESYAGPQRLPKSLGSVPRPGVGHI